MRLTSKLLPRFLLILTAGFFVAGNLRSALALPPEPFPPYADARSLRVDASLHAVAFADADRGIACGDRGTILRTSDGGRSWSLVDSSVDCRLSDVLWVNRRRVIIVGGGYDRITQISRAVVLASEDGGEHWRSVPANDLPKLTQLDRRDDGTLSARADWSHAMLANRFLSHDDGQSWLADYAPHQTPINQQRAAASVDCQQLLRWVQTTGIPVVVRDACQTGKSDLVAVADHGVIMRSDDNGKSWSTVRGQSNRTSVLVLAASRQSVAWGLVGKEALEHRNRVSLLVHRNKGVGGDLIDQVTVMLGGAGADEIFAEGGIDNVDTIASAWIGVHQPSVLVIDQTLDTKVQESFLRAAVESGVARVVSYRFGSGQTVIHRDALLPKSSVLVNDFATDAHQFISPHQRVPVSTAIDFRYDVGTTIRNGDSVTGGLRLAVGHQLSAPQSQPSRRRLQMIQARRAQWSRVESMIDARLPSEQFAESIQTMLNRTAQADRFRLLWSVFLETMHMSDSLAAGYQQICLREFVERFPATSAAAWSRLVSDARNHSIEWQRLLATVEATRPQAKASSVAVSPFQSNDNKVRQVSALAPILVPRSNADAVTNPMRSDGDARYTNKDPESLGLVDLAWEFHPQVLLAREAARQRGDEGILQPTEDASAQLQRLATSDDERWGPLVRRQSVRSRVAKRANIRPRLDGILNDACWRSALNIASETRTRFAYDDDYLYVAIETDAQQFGRNELSGQSRSQRDQNLHSADHLWLRIDTDGDLCTAYDFKVSATGRTSDGVDGHLAWNPTWYRELRTSENRVTIELAIDRRDLVDLPIHPGQHWYVSARTIVAGDPSLPPVIANPHDWIRVEFR